MMRRPIQTTKIIVSGHFCVKETYIGNMRKLKNTFTATLLINGISYREKDFIRLEVNEKMFWCDRITGTLYDEQTGRGVSDQLTVDIQSASHLPKAIESNMDTKDDASPN